MKPKASAGRLNFNYLHSSGVVNAWRIGMIDWSTSKGSCLCALLRIRDRDISVQRKVM